MRKQKTDTGKAGENVVDYRHKSSKKLNIPTAGLEARGEIAREKRIGWTYNPHLALVPRFGIAVKVIDPRGNEVLRVHHLGEYDRTS